MFVGQMIRFKDLKSKIWNGKLGLCAEILSNGKWKVLVFDNDTKRRRFLSIKVENMQPAEINTILTKSNDFYIDHIQPFGFNMIANRNIDIQTTVTYQDGKHILF